MKKILIILLLFVSFNVEAATYYVDFIAGNDSANGTSAATPWKHAPGMSGWTGSAALSSGDIVVLKGGVTWTFTSTTDNLITVPVANLTIMGGQQCGFTGSSRVACDGTTPCGSTASVSCNGGAAWGSGYPVLDGTGTTSTRLAIYGNARAGLTIDGIKIYNVGISETGAGFGIFGNASNFEVKNCWLETFAVDAISIQPDANTSAIYIHDNHFKNNGRVEISPPQSYLNNYNMDDIQIYNNLYEGVGSYDPVGFHTDGFMIQAESKGPNYGITNLSIHHNKFYGNWYSGATAQIYLSGCTKFGANSQCSGSGTPASCCTGNGTGTCTDFPNAMCTGSGTPYACCTGSLTGTCPASCVLGSLQGPYSTQHVQIYDNVFAFENNTSYGGAVFSPGNIALYNGAHNDAKIYNNTISDDAYTTNRALSCIAIVGVDTVDIKNNILSGCDNGIVGAADSSSVTVDYNLYNNIGSRFIYGWPGYPSNDCRSISACQGSPFNSEQHGKSGDPKFVALPSGGATGSGNWHLQVSSPAIGNGTNSVSGIFTTDLDGIARGGTYDIGAYQYATTPPAPTSNPSGPTSNPSSGSSSGCLIATAVYGTDTAQEVVILREFRDKILLTNPMGKQFLRLYYKFSPSLAQFISNHEYVRKIVRCGLLPVVLISHAILHYGVMAIAISFSIIIILTSGLCFLYITLLRRRGALFKLSQN